MEHSAPTITKEQYERLAKLSGEKELDFTMEREQYGFGDKLSAFLKEYTKDGSAINNTGSDVNFYKLFERVA